MWISLVKLTDFLIILFGGDIGLARSRIYMKDLHRRLGWARLGG